MKNIKNMKIYKILLAGSLLFSIAACTELDLAPEDQPSDATFFTKESDYRSYVNGLYNNITRNLQGGRASTKARVLATNADNYVWREGSNDALMQHSATGVPQVSSGLWNNSYTYIRNVNYLLDNKDRIGDASEESNQYIGEAYYIRAWHYLNLLQSFGGVPYIDKAYSADAPELFNPRDSRDETATKIIQDLDLAIELLGWKGEGFATAGRINKQCALTLKTRVGLYEGSWEYYHGRKSTPFAVSGNNGFEFLQDAVDAGDILIAKQGTNIYKGPADIEYSDLFIQDDYSSIAGAFFWKEFNIGLGIPAGTSESSRTFNQCGFTDRAANSYLMEDGLPESISTVSYDFTNQNSFIHSRDQRMEQTFLAPDRGLHNELFNVSAEGLRGIRYMVITGLFSADSGWATWKGGIPIPSTGEQNETDDLILRYGEALLNYAESKAILETISQADIDKSINVLRDRVGMVPMNLGQVNSWSVTYEESEGYDPTASNIVNEIRRERNVELMIEGFRNSDIKRWALYENVINGYKPNGAYYQELKDYFDDTATLAASGYTAGEAADLAYVEGININDDETGMYVNPFWNEPDFTDGTGTGYLIDANRDYLQSIPANEINFYEASQGVTLEQNPGWIN